MDNNNYYRYNKHMHDIWNHQQESDLKILNSPVRVKLFHHLRVHGYIYTYVVDDTIMWII